jgi:outer membrane receptor protein involved in Fe transport
VLASSQDQRAGGRGNLSAQLRDNWNFQLGTSYLTDHVRLPQNDNDVFGVMGGGLLGKAFDNATTHGFFEGVPPETFYAINTRQDVQRFENSINTSYQPLGWLTATGVFGLDYLNRYDNETLPPNEVNFGQNILGYRTSNPYQIFNYTSTGSLAGVWNPTANFKSTTTAAVQFNKELIRGTRAFGRALLAGTGSLSGTTSQFAVGETNTDNKTLGLIGREELAWRDRVFLTGALRNDKNSAFGQNFGSITYPSIQGSWVISDESFFPRTNILSSLRLRAADGRSGRQPNFRDAETYFSAQTVRVNGADVPGVVVGGTGNPNLRPEKSTADEFGADLGLWGQKLGVQVTHYEKITTDVLVAVPLAPSLGQTTTQFQNLGKLSNKGWEYTLNADLINTDRFGFSFTATGSKNDNEILSLGLLPSGAAIPPIVINSDQQHRNGYPVGGYWEVPYTYKDANGDGILSRTEVTMGDTAVYMGNPAPVHQFTFSPTVTFLKNFHVSALFDHKGGQKLLNLTSRFRCALGNCQENFDPSSTLADQAASLATIISSSDAGYIQDASFTKLRELSFTFTFPERIANAFHSRNIDLTVAGRNLHTWTNYRGFDPEVNSTPGTNFSTSDFLTLPPNRTWTARLNVNF